MPVTPKSSSPQTIRFHPYNPNNPILKFEGGRYAGDIKEINNTQFPHGRGSIIIERNKSPEFDFFYTGDWRDGTRTGKGRLIRGDHCIYNGEFHENKAHGLGILTEPHAKIYKGNWENGLRSGIGIQYDNRTIYFGNWNNNKLNGLGTSIVENGIIYHGGYKNNRCHGIGIVLAINGIKKYTGRWENGKPVGIGILSNGKSHILVDINSQLGKI